MDITASFTVSVQGESTGLAFVGSFTVKLLLTKTENFMADEKRRILLGAYPENALEELKLDALMLSQLHVRVVSAPQWWTDSENGTKMLDSNVVFEVFKSTTDKVQEFREKRKAEAAKALEQIKNSG